MRTNWGNGESKRWPIIGVNILFIFIVLYFIGNNLHSREPANFLSYAFTIFAGYLFFLLMPVELIFVYFAKEGPLDIVTLVFATVSLAMMSQSIDYFIGHSASQNIIKKLISHRKYTRAQNFLLTHGHKIIFIFNVLPLSSPILILATGVLGFPFRKVFILSSLGLLIKYSLIGILFSSS